MSKYYAVKVGKNTGIFETWEDCKENVIGYEGAQFKSFSKLEDANTYLLGEEVRIQNSNDIVAYVDGSYNVNTNEYSFGAILIKDNQLYQFKKKFEADQFSSSRNVAGEVRGASFIINYAYKQNIKELHLYYDYIGIEKFFTGEWKANKELSKLYQNFALEIKDKIKVVFHKVKSHSNEKYNDLVDSLAKEALGIS